MKFQFFKKSGSQQNIPQPIGKYTIIDARIAGLIADWLQPAEIASLSCTCKKYKTLFNKLIHKAVAELRAIQFVLQLENIDDLHHLLFDYDMSNILLKPRVKREIQTLLNLCNAYKVYADIMQSFLNSKMKIWSFQHERVFNHIENCKNAISPWLLSNNVIDVLQAYGDVFTMIKEMAQSDKINWTKLDKFLVSRLGTAQKKAGPIYVKMLLAALWTVGEPVNDQVDQRFIDRDHDLGHSYYLYVFNEQAGGGYAKSGAGRRGGCRRLKNLPLANMNSHITLLIGILERLLGQEFIEHENITAENRPSTETK